MQRGVEIESKRRLLYSRQCRLFHAFLGTSFQSGELFGDIVLFFFAREFRGGGDPTLDIVGRVQRYDLARRTQLNWIRVNGPDHCSREIGVGDVGQEHEGLIECAVGQVGAAKVGALQLRSPKAGALQLRLPKVRTLQLRLPKIGALQLRAREVGALQLRSAKEGTLQLR